MTLYRDLIAIALPLLLAGCISATPPRYFLLEATATSASGDYAGSIGLRPVRIPEYLRRTRMVRAETGNELDMSNDERWAEPLADGIRRVLILNLAAALPTDDIRSYPWSAGHRPDTELMLDVLDMSAEGGSVVLVVDADIIRADGRTEGHLIRLRTPLPEPATGAQTAAAYSDLLGQLAVTLAEGIRSDPQPSS